MYSVLDCIRMFIKDSVIVVGWLVVIVVKELLGNETDIWHAIQHVNIFFRLYNFWYNRLMYWKKY